VAVVVFMATLDSSIVNISLPAIARTLLSSGAWWIGLGQALFQAPNNSALMGAAPKDQHGSASRFLATSRVVGQSVSVALAGAMLVAQPHVPVARLSSLQQTFVSSFHATFLACAAIAALGIATSLVPGKERE